jgi:phage terminase Nu1 subunit (DNA packaging protein)
VAEGGGRGATEESDKLLFPVRVLVMPRKNAPSRERLTAAQAERAELLNEKLRGEMIPADEVRREWLDIRERLKRRLSMIPIRVAARTRDRHALEIVEKEVAAALNELSDDSI